MLFLIKFLIYFTISFAILCIPIGNRTVFSYLHELSSPYADEILQTLKSSSQDGIEKTKDVGRKLFSNSNPSDEDLANTTTSSSTNNDDPKKVKTVRKVAQEPQDSHTLEDEEFIEEMTKKEPFKDPFKD